MQRNIICGCGSQVRAETRELSTRGVTCPNCGDVVRLDPSKSSKSRSASDEFDDELAEEDEVSLDPSDYQGGTQKLGARGRRFSFLNLIPSPLLEPGWPIVALSTFLSTGLMVGAVLGLDQLSIVRKLKIPVDVAKKKGDEKPKVREPRVAWQDFNGWSKFPAEQKSARASLKIAENFVELAKQSQYNDMIKIFTTKQVADIVQYGREAVENTRSEDSKAVGQRKLITIMMKDFFDNSQAIALGYHDWRIIGYSVASDETAILVRYYREEKTPAELVSSEQVLSQIAGLINFDEFTENYKGIFNTKSLNIEASLKRGIKVKDFYASKLYGYAVLVFSHGAKSPALINLIDWQTDRSIHSFCREQMSLQVDDGKWVLKQADGNSADGSQVVLSNNSIALIQAWMAAGEGNTSLVTRGRIADAIDEVYASTEDPLMLDLRARMDLEQGNIGGARKSFQEAEEKGFQSLEAFKFFLMQSGERGDENGVSEYLKKLTEYWGVKSLGLEAREDRDKFLTFEKSWRKLQ